MEEPNWTTLVTGIKNGSRESYMSAYRLGWKIIFPGVFFLLKNKQEAEDIMQDGFVKGFARVHELHDPEKYLGWQKKICMNEALSAMRKNNRIRLEDIRDQHIVEDEEKNDWSEVQLKYIFQSLDQLPEGYRTVIRLYLIDDFSHEEIGKALGISASTARSQYARGMAKLKSTLKQTSYARS